MTQKDKELLIKDLCARLPYGVICKSKYIEYDDEDGNDVEYDKIGKLESVNAETVFIDNYPCEFEETTLYLRPMSSMTEEEKMYVNELIYNKDGLFLSPIPTWVINECDIDKYIDFCNSKHLDWRGLIPMGLALPAPDGMYNTKNE
jgi:hypothetical protein